MESKYWAFWEKGNGAFGREAQADRPHPPRGLGKPRNNKAN